MNNMQSSYIHRNRSSTFSQAPTSPGPMLKPRSKHVRPQQNYTPNTIPHIPQTSYMQHTPQMPHTPYTKYKPYTQTPSRRHSIDSCYTPSSRTYSKCSKIIHNPPRNLGFRLCISESELVERLLPHIIQPHLLRKYGFPVEHLGLKRSVEFWKPRFGPATENPTQENFGKNKDGGFTAFYTSVQINLDTNNGSDQIFAQRQCSRCQSTFHVARTGEYMNHEACIYHPEKFDRSTFKYSCCGRLDKSLGCSNNASHVWSGSVIGLNGPCTGFVQTRPRRKNAAGRRLSGSGSHTPKVYALDCEMSYTGRGLEVTKLTVVNFKGDVVYEHYVYPDCRIIDYNSRYSGITQNDFHPKSGNSIKSLEEVQQDLLQLFDSNTILIGHGLDNDLCALRLVHTRIVDTSIVFPHPRGYPYKKGLKSLTSDILGRQIQCGDEGHSCLEDARASLELMLFKENIKKFNV